MDVNLLPKVELHLHLDCCLSYKVVHQLDPAVTPEAYRESFIAPAKCTDLADYITRAVKGFELMQTREQLRLVTLDLFEQLQQDRVIYAELRLAPLQHTLKGLTPEEVVQTVVDATAEGVAKYAVQAGIILCTLRHYSALQSMQTVQLAEQFKGNMVIGFDIAADEAGFPIDNHITAFEYARERQISCTAHAGEARGADSVWETLKHFFPQRIGHGVRSIEDPDLLQYLLEKDIHLEVCVTSNIQANVYDHVEDHPADTIYKSGISMSVNTDARTISDTTLSNEYRLLETVFGWEKAKFLHCNLEAIRHAFALESVKDKIIQQLLEAYL
jgi:adenosine deaminase